MLSRGLIGLVAGAFIALSLSPLSVTRFYAWPWFACWQLLLVGPVLLLGFRLIARPEASPGFGLALDAGLGLFGVACFASACVSPFAPSSLVHSLIPISALCAACLALAWVSDPAADAPRRLAVLLQAAGAILLLFTVVSLGRWLWADVWPALAGGHALPIALAARNAHPFGHSTYVAGLAVLAAPWLAGLALTATGARRWLWCAGAILAVILVPTTASRGGVLGMAAAGAIWLWWLAARSGKARLAAGALGLAALGIGLVALDPRLRELVLTRRWGEMARESNRQRATMFEAGWVMGLDRPWTGQGPGAVPLAYPRYRSQISGGLDNALQLHNTPVQIWAETGAPGLVACLVLAGGAVGLVRAAVRLPASPRRTMACSVAAALTGYAVLSLTDYQLDVPFFLAAAALGLVTLRSGVLSAAPGEGRHRAPACPHRNLARGAGLALLAGLAVIARVAVPDLRARAVFAQAAAARERGDVAAFVSGALTAARLTPWNTWYDVQLASHLGERWLAGDPHAGAGCATTLERALCNDRALEYAHFNLGWLRLADAPAAAETHFLHAAQLAPNRIGVYTGLALSRLARRQHAAAAAALALEWLNDPLALTSPLWEEPALAPFRTAVLAAMRGISQEWRAQRDVPAEIADRLVYVTALAHWWHGGEPDPEALSRGNAAQRRFFATLREIRAGTDDGHPTAAPEPWARLLQAWRQRLPLPPGPDAAFTAAVARRIAREPDSFARVLTAPVGDDPALRVTKRNQRRGYAVLARNQDGFPVNDLHIYAENRLALAYAPFLFPRKGYLPTPWLLASLSRRASPTP